ncbi:MAG: hypothetical protein JWN70_2294 [Planctomycetaceae bacterium]|nr:hypothetical protein [Planctomycetaceae bacterium]
MSGILTATLPLGELSPMPINSEWIIEGLPMASGTILLQSADKKMSYGAWECTAGRFQWIFSWDEFVHIQEGEVIIHEEGSPTHHLRRGDLAHFPLGLKTVWHVPHYVRKVFTLRTPEPLG